MNHPPPPLKKNYQGNTTKKPESTGKIFTVYIIQCSWSIHQRCNIRIKLNFFDESFWRFNIHFLKVDLLWTSWKTIFCLTEKLLIVLDTVKDKCRHDWLVRNSLRRCQYCHSCVERTSIPRPSQDQVNFWKNCLTILQRNCTWYLWKRFFKWRWTENLQEKIQWDFVC